MNVIIGTTIAIFLVILLFLKEINISNNGRLKSVRINRYLSVAIVPFFIIFILFTIQNIHYSLNPSLMHKTEYAVSWLADNTPPIMEVGNSYDVRVIFWNDGSLEWLNHDPNPVYISYHWYTKYGELIDWEGERSGLAENIQSGYITMVITTLTAPSLPGEYVLKWDLVQEDITWFSQAGSPTLNIPVKVYIPPL